MPKPSKKESSKKSKSPENKESSVDEHDFIRKQFVEYWKNPRDDKFEKIITKEADSKTKITGNKPKPKKDFQLTLNLPEYKPEEVLVSTNGNVVEVKGKHQEKDEKGEMQTVRSFIKSFSITEDCDVSQLRSKFEKDGVLTISAPRKTEQ